VKKIILIFILSVLVLNCKNNENHENSSNSVSDEELGELFSLMQGSFNSEKQAKSDSTYYNISLHMYPIWKGKGHFLYVEQALASMQDKPYRQRIYEVKHVNDSVFSSAVYTLKSDSLWIGKWKTPKAFDSLKISDINLKEGCEVMLKRLGENHFKGKTGENTCPSSMRGAAFAGSEVEIFKDKIISWDRGFDDEGKYVWGAKNGGYIFEKIK
jgi:hypothetical protein